MLKYTIATAILFLGCKANESGSPAAKPADNPAPPAATKAAAPAATPVAAPAPAPAPAPAAAPAPAPVPEIPSPTSSPPKATAIAGFKRGAQIDLPDGFVLGEHSPIDGEGEWVTATRGDVTLDLIYTLGKQHPVMAEHKRDMEVGGKVTWKRESKDESGWMLVSEAEGKSTVSVYRRSVHGFCSAHEVPASKVDAVIAICTTLRPT